MKTHDEGWMRLAINLGARALGQTAPNPAVGCVIVKDDCLVGRGWTQAGGRPHAEVVALQQAGKQTKGATAYVTLEPCAHTGKTPPCAHALIKAGITRVVIAITDPDPRVAGKGIEILRNAGIDVDVGCLQKEASETHAGFFTRFTKQRPFVTLKLASSLDGKIATKTGHSQWITNPASRSQVHLMRARHDGILVGRSTAELDDPDLRVRLPGLASQSPTRIVLDSNLSLPPTLSMLATADITPVIICHASGADTKEWSKTNAQLVACETDENGRADIQHCLQKLSELGLTRILCEGGGTVAAALLKADLVDELVTFHAGLMIGKSGLASMGELDLDSLTDATRFALVDQVDIQGDVMSTWRRVPSG